MVGLLIFLLFFNCGKRELVKQKEDAYTLLRKGISLMEEKRYDKAINYFNEIINLHSGSPYFADAQFYLANCYYLKKDYLSAKMEFEFFIKTFRASPFYEEGLYKLALSQLKLALSRKNIKELDDVKEVFLDFKEEYPNSQFLPLVEKHLNEIDSVIAESKLASGYLYYKNGEWKAAEIYFDYVINTYPQTLPAKEASIYLAEILLKNGRNDEAKRYLSLLNQDSLPLYLQKRVAKLLNKIEW